MRTLIVLCLLLSVASGRVLAQEPASGEAWQVDPVEQRQRDAARKSILEDELASEARQFADAYAKWRDARDRHVEAAKLDELAEQADRHRRNMAELGRELARPEGKPDASAPVAERAGERNRITSDQRSETAQEWIIPASGPGAADDQGR